MRRSFDLVIFDHDGVLVDSEIIAMDLLATIASDHGYPVTVDEAIEQFLGTSLDHFVGIVRNEGTVEPVLEELDRDFHARLFDGFRDRLVAIPGMRGLLDELRRLEVPVCIASSGSRERVMLGITTTGLVEFFAEDAITTREDVQRGKPAPDLFERAAARASTPAGRCLVVEDSQHGVEAAHRAGMAVVGMSYRTPASVLNDADWVVTDPTDIIGIVTGSATSSTVGGTAN